MNTKKKNKNRPKPPNIPPKLDSVETGKSDGGDNIINVSNIESEKSESAEKIPTILPEAIATIVEKNITDEVPKKPERTKGKKQQESSDVSDDKNKLLEEQEQQKVVASDVNAPITPKSRKKKNKDKKQITTQEVNKTEGGDEISKININDVKQNKEVSENLLETSINISQEEQDTKVTKKKKKKRNRYDSQKSDIDETTACNLAFKNLLEATEDKDNTLQQKNANVTNDNIPLDSTNKSKIVDDENIFINDLSKTDKNINTREQEEHHSKNKKKGKKQKAHQEKADYENKKEISVIEKQEEKSLDLQEPSIDKQEEKILDLQEPSIRKQEVKSLDLQEPSFDDSVVKAKIAKPVDKKRKVKSPKQTTSSDIQSIDLEQKYFEQKSEIDTVETQPIESKNIFKSFEEKTVINPNETNDAKESKKPDLTTPEVDTSGEQERNVTVDDSSEDIFMEVKPSKKKKKSKNLSYTAGQTETEPDVEKNTLALKENIEESNKSIDYKPVSSDIHAEVIKSHTTSNVTDEISGTSVPDIIQCPRSSSQQLLSDKSSSMFIQEIPATEEIKLDMQLCTSVPVIQGSGETPEARLEKDPMRIKLTEIDSKLNKCVEEKTDIKSKMMEVNKDMEELRLSIERSLAELTALDKGDKEFEKVIEDNKKTVDSNIDKNLSKETLSSVVFPMPSTLVEKPPLSDDVKTDPKHVCVSPEKEIITIIKEEEKEKETHDLKMSDNQEKPIEPPVCPSRKDNKGKSKSKKKNKQESSTTNTTSTEAKPSTSDSKSTDEANKEQKSNKNDNAQNKSQEKGKQQSSQDGSNVNNDDEIIPVAPATSFEPIENFEDALTSSVDDVNTTFEMIAKEIINSEVPHQHFENPQINIIAPTEDESADKNKKDKQVTPPKNLLGHPDIPVPSNKTDYKKEKNKLPNNQQAKVKIKDSVDIEKKEKVSKQSQTCSNKSNPKYMNGSESFSYMTNGNNEFVYKYSFRKVFLQSYCHFCKKELNQRFSCKFCSLIFYCSQKHMDEDWPRHQPLCFAVSTISHLKDQKHIYADAKGITGQDYRVLRMQMIVSCEKILKRKLVPWEQEALLYPRICANSNCREWKQSKLKDCKGCEQVSYCSDYEDHLPTEHLRWCKSYALYKKLVNYQQTKGRLEPPMPTKILENYEIPEKINDVLASMYEEKIDMNDIQYAALTQLATAPLTVAYCYQIFSNNNSATNKFAKKTSFTVHVVGAELQFEADGLNKWEIFLLHLRPEIRDLRIVLVNPDLNPSKLPLDLLGKVPLCENCKSYKRRVIFSFQDKLTYHAYYSSDDFITPDIVCAFNPSIERSSIYNGKDSWPSTTRCILKQKVPFSITSYSLEELKRDLERMKEFGDVKVILEPKPNPFASVRPDRNFITDHEIPLLFKNYCLSMVCAT